MTNPVHSMGYACLYCSIGNSGQEAKVVVRKVSGRARKNSPAQTVEKMKAAKLKVWNHMVPREVILSDYYAHLVSNVPGVVWEKVGTVLQNFFCEPVTNVSERQMHLNDSE